MKKLVLLWLASLTTVAGATATFTLAQTRQPEPRILSGADIGFRVDGRDPRTGSPTGTLMVRLNGEWVEVGAAGERGFSSQKIGDTADKRALLSDELLQLLVRQLEMVSSTAWWSAAIYAAGEPPR